MVSFSPDAAGPAAVPQLQTEPLNGLPSWPLTLLAGVEGSGKTTEAVIASATDMVGRTLWCNVGERVPHQYGQVPGQRVELVHHDGTYRGILDSITAMVAQPRVDPAKPNLIVLDSATKVWHLISDNAQEQANVRARKKGRYVGDDGADVDRDLWNLATARWRHILETLKEHDGPVILTARLDLQADTDPETGQPYKDSRKIWKPIGQKMLSYDVDAVVHFRASYPERDNWLAKLNQFGFERKVRRGKVVLTPLEDDFSMEWLWDKIGLRNAEAITRRQESTYRVQSDHAQQIERDELLATVLEAAHAAGVDPSRINDQWMAERNGQRIDQTTDLDGLRTLLAGLQAKSQTAAPTQTAPAAPAAEVDTLDADRAHVLNQISTHAALLGIPTADVAARWAEAHDGEDIRVTRNLDALRLVLADLQLRAANVAQGARPEETATRADDARTNEAARAPEPAQRAPEPGPSHASAVNDAAMQTALAELTFQAETLEIPFTEHTRPVMADQSGDEAGYVRGPKMSLYLMEQRPHVIEVLRMKGQARVADAYEQRRGDSLVNPRDLFTDEPFTREPAGNDVNDG